MKTTIVLFLSLLVSAPAYSQASVDGFWGIKFGSSKSEAIKQVRAKEGVNYASQKSNEKTLAYYDVDNFADEQCEVVYFSFVDDKMYEGGAFIIPSNENEILNLYNNMADKISLKYGIPTETSMKFIEPFAEDDGKTIEAIKADKAKIASIWLFKDELLGQQTNRIALIITSDMDVFLIYEDTHLSDIVKVKKKKQQKGLDDL